MYEVLISLILSPVLAAMITIFLNRSRIEPIMNLQNKVIGLIKQLNEDDEFAASKIEYGNFVTVVYETLVMRSDAMTTIDFIKIQQRLLASAKRMDLVSTHNITDTKILPMLYQLGDVKIKSHYNVAISAALSALFAIINLIDCSKREVLI